MKQLSIAAVCLSLLLLGTTAWGEGKGDPDLVIVTGEHWTTASRDEKMAYLFGVGNILEIEQAMQGENPGKQIRNNSIVPVMIEGLSGQSITKLRGKLDQWYKKYPDQLKRPVIEVLYKEFALPNTKS